MRLKQHKLETIKCPNCETRTKGHYRGRKQKKDGIRITEHKVWKCCECNRLVWGKGKLSRIENDYERMYRSQLKQTKKEEITMTNVQTADVTEDTINDFVDATLQQATVHQSDEGLQGSRSDKIAREEKILDNLIAGLKDTRYAASITIDISENPRETDANRVTECGLPDEYLGRPDPWAWYHVNGFKSNLGLSDEVLTNEWALELVNQRSLLLLRTAAAKIRKIFERDANGKMTFPRGERVWYDDTLIFLHPVYQSLPEGSTWEDLGVDEGDVHPKNPEMALRWFEFFCTDDHRGYKVCYRVAARDWSWRAVDAEERFKKYDEVNKKQGYIYGLKEGANATKALDGMVEDLDVASTGSSFLG